MEEGLLISVCIVLMVCTYPISTDKARRPHVRYLNVANLGLPVGGRGEEGEGKGGTEGTAIKHAEQHIFKDPG